MEECRCFKRRRRDEEMKRSTLKRELDGKDWCQRSPCGAKPLRDGSEVRLHGYSEIMKLRPR